MFGPQLSLLQRDPDGKIIYDKRGLTKPIKDRFGEFVIVNTDPPKPKVPANSSNKKTISVTEDTTKSVSPPKSPPKKSASKSKEKELPPVKLTNNK